MEDTKDSVSPKEFFHLAIQGGLVGFFAGLAVLLYRVLIDNSVSWISNYYSKASFLSILPLIFIFLIFSFICVFFIKWAPLSGGSGIPQVVGELKGKFNMNPVKVTISKFVGGILSALGGLSMGREGPSVQIGAACGKLVSKFTRNKKREMELISAGAGAGLAGAFCSPLSGVLITMEEFHKSFDAHIFIPTISACVVTSAMSKYFFGPSLMFSFTAAVHLPLHLYFHVICLGIFVAIIGIAFSEGLQAIQRYMKKTKLRQEYLIYICFLLAIIFGLTLPEILGGGHEIVENLLNFKGSLVFLTIVLIFKLLFTGVCFGSGIQGGTLVPTLAIGAMAGAIYFMALNKLGIHIDDQYYVNFIILAMSAMLASVMRSSLTAILIVVEMTGSYVHLLAFALIVLVAHTVAELFRSKPFYESLLDNMLKQNK